MLLLWLLLNWLSFCHHHSESLLLFVQHGVLRRRYVIKVLLPLFIVVLFILLWLISCLACVFCWCRTEIAFVYVVDNILLEIFLILWLRVIVEERHQNGILVKDHVFENISLVVIDGTFTVQLLDELKTGLGSIGSFFVFHKIIKCF